MKIKIARREKPFSHTPGCMCVIPGTDVYIQAFPAFFQIIHKEKKIPLELSVTGPVKNFTLELDLEMNCVRIFGHAREGFYRFCVRGNPQGIEVVDEKKKEKKFFPIELSYFQKEKRERLFLGLNKEQDWDLVSRRFDLQEILPTLFMLGQLSPSSSETCNLGTARLLQEGNLDAFCRAAFSGILVPRIFDDQYQGLAKQEGKEKDPFFLLRNASDAIRSLFFERKGNEVFILNASSFPSGRMVDIEDEIGTFSLEWASRRLKKIVIHAKKDASFFLKLGEGSHSFRMKERHSCKDPLVLHAGKTYVLDRFHK